MKSAPKLLKYEAQKVILSIIVVLLLASLTADRVLAAEEREDNSRDKVQNLEKKVQDLVEEIEKLKQKQSEEQAERKKEKEKVSEMAAELDEVKEAPAFDAESWLNKFELGGYGEMHANFSESGDSQFDIHRLVLYLGYDFNEWIKLHSDTAIEHAFVAGGDGSEGDGELVMEQAYVDFLLSEPLNARVGRILTPVGIINKWHEPTTFNGVERPAFAHDVIPTTWSSDGAGIFGRLSPQVSYEAYVVGGLDGSGFDALEGIRGGRLKERPSLNDPAATARMDYRPFAVTGSEWARNLRLGLSGYYGGINNGDEGDDPGIDGDIGIYSADFEYSISDFDFRGVFAREHIDGADDLAGGVAEVISGWYLEAGYHFMPESWKTGKLSESDAVAFVRYDQVDTQHDMPSGVSADPRGDREEVTLGISWFLTRQFVVKADYEIRDDESGEDPDNAFNVGVGWVF